MNKKYKRMFSISAQSLLDAARWMQPENSIWSFGVENGWRVSRDWHLPWISASTQESSIGKVNFLAFYYRSSSISLTASLKSPIVGNGALFRSSQQTRAKKTSKANPQLNNRAINTLPYQGRSAIALYRKKAKTKANAVPTAFIFGFQK